MLGPNHPEMEKGEAENGEARDPERDRNGVDLEPGQSLQKVRADPEFQETVSVRVQRIETRKRFRSQGLNWEILGEGEEIERPVLMPGDVQQVCFLVEEILGTGGEQLESTDGRLIFGVLNLGWKGTMGSRGFLSTGTLGARLK
ncbi:hypothetical protein BUE80_DR013959 [Diplocarpon rosae]|nr:hypothetical protein BUE80_DR013959 [Diplocarpon rosae]